MGAFTDAVNAIATKLAFWEMQETSGTNIVDSVSGNNMVAVNAPTLGAASLVPSIPAGKSISFDGVNDYLRQPLPVIYKLNVLSFMVVFRVPTTWITASIVALEPRGFGGVGLGFDLVTIAGGELRLRKGINGSFVNLSGAFTFVAGQTYLIFGVVGNTGMKLYIQNTLHASNADVNAMVWADLGAGNYPDPAQMYVGAERNNGPAADNIVANSLFVVARISHLAIFSGEISPTQIATIVTGFNAVPDPIFVDPQVGATYDDVVPIEWVSVNNVEGDYSIDGGVNWSPIFTLQAATTFNWDTSLVSNNHNILIRIRAHDGTNYSIYNQISIIIFHLPAVTNFGITTVSEHTVRVDVPVIANLERTDIRIDTYPSGDFSAPIVTVTGNINTPAKCWCFGLTADTKYLLQYRTKVNGIVGAWSASIPFYTKRVRILLGTGIPAELTHAYALDDEGVANTFASPFQARYASFQSPGFTPYSPIEIPDLGIRLREFSPDGDQERYAALFNCMVGGPQPNDNDFSLVYTAFQMVQLADVSLNTALNGIARTPSSLFIAFVPMPGDEGRIQELHGGDGWWITIWSDGRLRYSSNTTGVGAARQEIFVGPVRFGDINMLYLQTLSGPMEVKAILNNGAVQTLNVNPALTPDTGNSMWYAKGTSYGNIGVESPNSRHAASFRGFITVGAYWNNTVLVEAAVRALMNAYGTSTFLADLASLSPYMRFRFADYISPSIPSGVMEFV